MSLEARVALGNVIDILNKLQLMSDQCTDEIVRCSYRKTCDGLEQLRDVMRMRVREMNADFESKRSAM